MRDELNEILAACDKQLVDLRAEYQQARSDPSVDGVSRVAVKIALEQLRSVLDYLAWAIHERALSGSPDAKVYFPFGKEEQVRVHIKRVFPGLSPSLTALLESVQAHRQGSDWLTVLCKQTNINKHKGLSKQERTAQHTVHIGGAFEIGPGIEAHMWGNVANGVPVEPVGRKVVVRSDMPVEQLRSKFNPRILVKRSVDGYTFRLDGTKWDALHLLEVARERIGDLADSVCGELRL
jgi:hypothetical protein